ncbi:MAG: HAMP domain-containing histidine kinase [Balneolaceae bacterium]|nr:HAMP domain-containing histidine kinase [Balneolaceae bacterium]MBO6546001.1 HAMP domain-containing histidine kinase [Balneolaceae bacterium]MBO6647397.1 HAMP domain-containing histidine kinase [Balneolaceae bacterium]
MSFKLEDYFNHGLAIAVCMVFLNLTVISLSAQNIEYTIPDEKRLISPQLPAHQNQFFYQINDTFKTDTDLQAAEDRLEELQIYFFVVLVLLLISLALAVWSYRLMRSRDQASKEISRINKDKDHFIGVVSHDLRSPLNSIMALSSLMVEDSKTSEKEVSEFSSIILSSSKRMESLINNMLDANKIETGNTKLILEPVSITQAIGEIADSTTLLGSEKDIKTNIEIDEDLPDVIADFDAVQRVLENLISNAYKFSPKGSTVTISATKEGNQVQVAVIDHGPGMSELDRSKLFTKFEKLSASPTGNEKSTGLGLFIVKNLMTEMKSTILVESELDKGTTFKILFNIA